MKDEPLTGYIVFVSPKDEMPWVCELEEVSRSPMGNSVRFKTIDVDTNKMWAYPINALPPDSKSKALEQYQMNRIGYLFEQSEQCYALRVKQIIAAEELLKPYRLIEKIFGPSHD